jgi:Putative transposase DNA-binding domain.
MPLWRRLWNLVSQQYWFPSYTSTVCPVHGAKIVYQPDGGNAPRVGVCEKGKEKWHEDAVALYNLGRRAGDVSQMPFGSKESYDPPTIKLDRWLRAKPLHSIMNEDKK